MYNPWIIIPANIPVNISTKNKMPNRKLLTVPVSSRSPSPSSLSQASQGLESRQAATGNLIWAFFRDAQGDEEDFHVDNKGRKFKNHYCLKCAVKDLNETPWRGCFTTNAKTHLLNKHELDIDAREYTYKITAIII